jgi:hypothetical protein
MRRHSLIDNPDDVAGFSESIREVTVAIGLTADDDNSVSHDSIVDDSIR